MADAGRRALVVGWRDAWRILHGQSPVAAALAVEPWSDEWPRLLRTGEPTYAGLELDDLAGSLRPARGHRDGRAATSVEETAERWCAWPPRAPSGP